MSNSLPASAFPDDEVSALKSRLAEATIALDRVEAAVVSIDSDAPAEVYALAATVLAQVLSSADHISRLSNQQHQVLPTEVCTGQVKMKEQSKRRT